LRFEGFYWKRDVLYAARGRAQDAFRMPECFVSSSNRNQFSRVAVQTSGLAERWVAMMGDLTCRCWASSWCGWRAAMALRSGSSIPREGGMEWEATRTDERGDPRQDRRFGGSPRSASQAFSGS
jgi:hypothetical protein